MHVFNAVEQDILRTKVFNTALVDEVIINNSDGNRYRILPIDETSKKGKSPFEDIPRMKLSITTQEIVELLQECRAGEYTD